MNRLKVWTLVNALGADDDYERRSEVTLGSDLISEPASEKSLPLRRRRVFMFPSNSRDSLKERIKGSIPAVMTGVAQREPTRNEAKLAPGLSTLPPLVVKPRPFKTERRKHFEHKISVSCIKL